MPIERAEDHLHWGFARGLLRQAIENELDLLEIYTDEEIAEANAESTEAEDEQPEESGDA